MLFLETQKKGWENHSKVKWMCCCMLSPFWLIWCIFFPLQADPNYAHSIHHWNIQCEFKEKNGWTFTWSEKMSIFYAFLAMHFVQRWKPTQIFKIVKQCMLSSDTMNVDRICVIVWTFFSSSQKSFTLNDKTKNGNYFLDPFQCVNIYHVHIIQYAFASFGCTCSVYPCAYCIHSHAVGSCLECKMSYIPIW